MTVCSEEQVDEDKFLNVSVKESLREENERLKFDAILNRPLPEWSKIEDVAELKDALQSLLGGLRSTKPTSGADDLARPSQRKSVGSSGISYEDCASPVDDQNYEERAKYIPLRINSEERALLSNAEAALDVSEYTDRVDVLIFSTTKMRELTLSQIREFLSVVSGLLIANDYAQGSKVLKSEEFSEHAELYQSIFEVARRHKISNPDKMRTDYGKMIYLLQDSQSPQIKSQLKCSLVKPLRTVHSFLTENGAIELLQEPGLEIASRDVSSIFKDRVLVEWELEQKKASQEEIVRRWTEEREDGSPRLSEDDVRLVLESIGDSNSFLRSARDPCDEIMRYLKKYFKKDDANDKETSLAIVNARGGARLTHSHKQQYNYVSQSLMLWREVMNDMYKLWYLAEKDLLDPNNPYSLRSTAQGLNRVQSADNISHAMRDILARVKTKVSSWVGSWMIHLGDHDVPNAMSFIDKYIQIALFVDNKFGGPEEAKRAILRDFFRHGFDGSGADNYYDAGSCIDGRLTSAWNWCQEIEKKPFFTLFLLCGFSGFDGQF